MPAEQQIAKKELLFLHRILCGPPTKLIKQVYDEQKKLDMPRCWSEEIKIIKQKYNLENYSDEEIGNLSKYCWKKTVDRAIRTKLRIELESMRKEKSKIANIETFERKEYLTELKSEDARVAIKSRLMMLNLATNYKNGKANLDCPLCEEEEDTLSHMTYCRKYSHLDSSFYTDDLFSSETVNILKATIAIKDRMQIRAQLLNNQ